MVFLDRDNTLIANDGDLGDPNAVVLLDGVPEGLVRLRDAGFVLVVVTNQGGVARGNYHEEDVDQVHAEIARLIDLKSGRKGVIDRFYYCPFHPDGKVEKYRGEHSWRKPQPGMLLQAAMDLDLDLESSWMIGDQPRDIEAGINAGCRTVQLGTPDSMSHQADASATDLANAVDIVLATPNQQGRLPGEVVPTTTNLHPPELDEDEPLRRAVKELSDQIRGRDTVGTTRGMAVTCMILSPIPLVIGLLALPDLTSFMAWAIGAVVLLLIAITMLMVERR